MSDFPAFDSAYVSRHRSQSQSDVRIGEDSADDSSDDDLLPELEPRPLREGLPSTYRMRAEPHYVEALVRPAASAAAREPVPSSTPPEPAPRLDAALGAAAMALSQAVDAIGAALAELPSRGRPLRERLAIELAKAESVRAQWLAEALAVLQTDPLPVLDQVDLASVLARVQDALGPEHRITGSAPRITVPGGSFPVFGDERLLVVAVGGCLLALRGLVEEHGDPGRLTVDVARQPAGASAQAVILAQHAVRVPASAEARFFEAEWTDHPAGPTGAVLLAAARRIAALQGGSLDLRPLDDGGCQLQVSLPSAG